MSRCAAHLVHESGWKITPANGAYRVDGSAGEVQWCLTLPEAFHMVDLILIVIYLDWVLENRPAGLTLVRLTDRRSSS